MSLLVYAKFQLRTQQLLRYLLTKIQVNEPYLFTDLLSLKIIVLQKKILGASLRFYSSNWLNEN